MRSRPGEAGESGQAAAELTALLPLLALLCALAWQLALAGHAVWAVSSAARAAARARAVGGDESAAARTALPPSLERRLRVQAAGEDGVRVVVAIPSVAAGLRLADVAATARFAPQGG